MRMRMSIIDVGRRLGDAIDPFRSFFLKKKQFFFEKFERDLNFQGNTAGMPALRMLVLRARCEVARARAEALRAPPAHPERMSCRRAAAGGSSGLIVRAAKHTACTRAVSGGSADTSGQLQ